MSLLEIVSAIETERQKQGITIKDLTRHAGISQYTYYHWIERRGMPKIDALSCVMDVLNLDVELTNRGGKANENKAN